MSHQKHILCITSGLTGILYASFELVKRLETAGYQVTYASPKAVGEKVEANDIVYQQLEEVDLKFSPSIPVKGKWARWIYKFQHRKQLQATALQSLKMDKFVEILTELSPDLVLVDVELHEHFMTSFTRAIPTILLSQWFVLGEAKNVPPLLHDTLPNSGWHGGRLGIAVAWWRIRIHRKWMFGKQKIRSLRTDRRSILKAYAKKIGFPMQYANENYWPGPFTYNSLPILSMTLWEMEFPHRKRKGMHYVGAMVNTRRDERHIPREVQAQLDTIFEQKKAQQKHLVYCSVSTLKQGDSDFLKRIIQVFKNRKDWILLIGLGGLLSSEEFDDLPENVHAFAWIPQLKVLAEADCSINHGGIHTINECIHFQVPMLVYSGKRSDQNGCAARVHYHGLGMMADKDKDSVSEIEKNIETVLTETSYRENITKMWQYYQNHISEKTLIQLIGQHL